MGSTPAREIEKDTVFDLAETIFVAVGKHVERNKTSLYWALQNFPMKNICLLHVHQPARASAFNMKLVGSRMKHFVEADKRKMQENLNEYLLLLSEAGVEGYKVWIEMDSVENGIIELIAQHNIKWLVMGAADDKWYSRNLSGLKSKKASFVCQKAPDRCHIWFTCKGFLIYTRVGNDNRVDIKVTAPIELLDTDVEIGQLTQLQSAETTNSLSSPEINSFQSCSDMEEDSSDLEGRLGESDCLYSPTSSLSSAEAISIIKATTPKAQAKALESLCIKELTRRKELKVLLERVKKEQESIECQRDKFTKEFQAIQDHNERAERQIAESRCSARELEEKIISAVGLLISFKKQRDEMRIENRNAQVKKVTRLVDGEGPSFCSELLEFSFVEINEATNDFDPSWKIGEGKYGSVYRGFLRHVDVAIRMLPSYGSQSLAEFQDQVEFLSRVRHPNLVTLIGTCPESRSLVYEYLRNGSLDDYLSLEGKFPPLPLETRIQIACEICSALLFLHSSRPCITHGNLKSSKILLDSCLTSKIIDFGIYNYTTLFKESKPEVIALHTDLNYCDTGMVDPESDVYSFGIILLQLLTRRPVSGVVRDVKCALENDKLNTVLDSSAGNWPFVQVKELACYALRCCDKNQSNRPVLSKMLRLLEWMRDSCNNSASDLSSREPRRTPPHFVCPIFQEVMDDPRIAADGFTYEADAIGGWINSGHNTSPMTNLKLDHCNLLPNYALLQAIEEWQQQR